MAEKENTDPRPINEWFTENMAMYISLALDKAPYDTVSIEELATIKKINMDYIVDNSYFTSEIISKHFCNVIKFSNKDFKNFKYLISLEELDINSSGFIKVTNSDGKTIYDYYSWFKNSDVDNLDFLAHCSNLKKLIFPSNKIKDISILAKISTLEEVQLDYSIVTDFSPLNKKIKLTALNQNITLDKQVLNQNILEIDNPLKKPSGNFITPSQIFFEGKSTEKKSKIIWEDMSDSGRVYFDFDEENDNWKISGRVTVPYTE